MGRLSHSASAAADRGGGGLVTTRETRAALSQHVFLSLVPALARPRHAHVMVASAGDRCPQDVWDDEGTRPFLSDSLGTAASIGAISGRRGTSLAGLRSSVSM